MNVENMTPQEALRIAREVIKGRWPEAEHIIAQDGSYAAEYACSIIKGRWPEAEDVISKDAGGAYVYAYNVIKGRWHEAEEVIAQDSLWKSFYSNAFFPAQQYVVTKDEVGEIKWNRLGLPGYFAYDFWFEPRPISVLDMVIES
jgi:hypothetical protein